MMQGAGEGDRLKEETSLAMGEQLHHVFLGVQTMCLSAACLLCAMFAPVSHYTEDVAAPPARPPPVPVGIHGIGNLGVYFWGAKEMKSKTHNKSERETTDKTEKTKY
jgi:hypothetical protein